MNALIFVLCVVVAFAIHFKIVKPIFKFEA